MTDTPPDPCQAEPIHTPAAVQPPGVLVAVDDGLTVVAASDNAAAAVGATGSIVGTRLSDWLDAACVADLRARVDRHAIDPTPMYLGTVRPPAGAAYHDLIVHRHDGVTIVELQPADGPHPAVFQDLYRLARTGIAAMEAAADPMDLLAAAAAEVRRLTGFARVMVYRFDDNDDGQVVAESLADGVPSWLGLRYPASDIPAQARAMYRTSRFRAVPDVAYEPVPVRPAVLPSTGRPLDLTHAVGRSVSPVHLEYLRNLGVAASASGSIVRDGRLWGLILCHHPTPLRPSFAARTAVDLLGQVLALQLSAKERARDAEASVGLRSTAAALLQSMSAANDVAAGLAACPARTLALADATGCAVTDGDGIPVLIGRTPDAAAVQAIADWLATAAADVFDTDHLSAVHPPAAAYVGDASGLLAIAVNRAAGAWVMWFRPEVLDERHWAGDPTKPHQITAHGRTIRPRRDFAAWKQTLRARSVGWSVPHRDAADHLRQAAVSVVLRQATERAHLTAQLQQSNRELEAFSYSVSHDLRAPFRHIAGFADLLTKRAGPSLDETCCRYVRTITDAARFAGTLVDSLLALSQVGRTPLKLAPVDLNRLVAEVRREVTAAEADGRDIDWHVGPLPTVPGDLVMLRLALRNLLSNAVKYTRRRPRATIEIGTVDRAATIPPDAAHVVLFVRDDGAGFDMRYRDKLFGVFQRLHRPEEFEGTGVGLANVRRIVERHGGHVDVTSRPDVGTTFYLSLPRGDVA